MKKKNTELLMLLIGGIGMTFSGLNWQIGILAWISPIGLLFYTRNSRGLRFVLFFFVMAVAGYISQTCNNLFNDFTFGLINGVAYGIIHTGIYFIDKLIYKKGKGFYSTLIFPAVFVVVEFLISLLIGTSGIVAQTQFAFKPLAQLSTVTGIFGITFVVIWFASVVSWVIENDFSKYSLRKSILFYGSVFLIIMIFGIIRVSLHTGYQSSVKVACISGITDIHYFAKKEQEELIKLVNNPALDIPKRIFAREEAIQNQIANTFEAAKEGAKIIVWNEDALILNQNQLDTLLMKVKDIAETYNTCILLAFLEENNSSEHKIFNNKSLLISPTGKVAWEYRKSHLAPAEIPIVNSGNSVIPYIDTEYGRIGNVICYDLDFTGFLRQAGKNSIDIMLVPAYDWKEYALLHSKMAQFEALQSGYSIIRSNGAGINMVADNRGNIIAKMNTFTSNLKILYADLPLKQVTTIYSKTGNIFVYVLMLFLIGILCIRIIHRA